MVLYELMVCYYLLLFCEGKYIDFDFFFKWYEKIDFDEKIMDFMEKNSYICICIN